MRDFLKSSGRDVSGGWFSFWAAVLLILPNCSFNPSGVGPGPNLHRGSQPHTSVVFCDIAREQRCATPEDIAMGTRLASAAVALVAGQAGTIIGLDDRPVAMAACGGVPRTLVFQDAFPRGMPVCVNCGDIIPATYPDPAAICQAQCHDLFGTMLTDGTIIPENPPSGDTVNFCLQNARPSTNFPLNGCFDDACLTAGTLRDDFEDPRRIPEPVDWLNLNGVTAAGGSLTRSAATTGDFDAGASSSQLIASGDGYVEFTATETNSARVAGLSSGPPPPGGISFFDVGFGILLTETGEMFVVENGPAVSSFGAYAAGEKFRVRLQDRFDGSATVIYTRVIGPCVDGSPCLEAKFHTSTNTATYPVRVDAMFREQGGTVTEARIVRIR